ncbi:MAG: AAA family ATPase [Chlamydiota bacterium]
MAKTPPPIKRTYESVIEEHFEENRQMLFLVGPRQVGKTTTSLKVSMQEKNPHYLNWDIQTDRKLITEGADKVFSSLNLIQDTAIIIFDELHKYRKWKTFIKGFFDKYGSKLHIIVTGSARLDIYKAGGDSLMGRYFLYRLHPLSVGELAYPFLRKTDIAPKSKKIPDEAFQALFQYGGFPEPYQKRKESFSIRWNKLRNKQLFAEDLRDLTKIQDLNQMEILAEILTMQASQLTNYTSLAGKVNTSVDTIRRWIKTLKSFYFCFTIQPWKKNISRSILKEPKLYLWDWSLVEDYGARVENFIASHLYKAVHFWTDRGLGEYDLYFLRDKEKREVDFLIVKNKKPWILVEAKASTNAGISKSLYYYQEMTKAPFAFQVVFDMDYKEGDCFSTSSPTIVPAKTFLSQLV